MAITVWTAGQQVLAATINTNFNETIFALPAYQPAGGTANAITATFSPSPGTLTAGQRFRIKIATTNTQGTVTLNPNSLGAKTIKKYGQLLNYGDLVAGQIVEVVYDGTDMQLQTPAVTDARGFSLSFFVVGTANKSAGNDTPCGYSDDTIKVFTVAAYGGGSGDDVGVGRFGVASDVGVQPYLLTTPTSYDASTVNAMGVVTNVTDDWVSLSNNNILKNGTAVTIATGGSVNGPLGLDPTNDYLLMLTGTTNIRRWSGIAGTTITQVDNITLDTAVTNTCGFIFDDANDRYICVDKTNNLLRRFNSAGVTVDTVAYTFDDAKMVGITVIAGRVFAVVQNSAATEGGSSPRLSCIQMILIPTAMVI